MTTWMGCYIGGSTRTGPCTGGSALVALYRAPTGDARIAQASLRFAQPLPISNLPQMVRTRRRPLVHLRAALTLRHARDFRQMNEHQFLRRSPAEIPTEIHSFRDGTCVRCEAVRRVRRKRSAALSCWIYLAFWLNTVRCGRLSHSRSLALGSRSRSCPYVWCGLRLRGARATRRGAGGAGRETQIADESRTRPEHLK